eukprot:jgi/Bigna1/68349/fgenesh1_pg.6_\
MFGSSSDDVVIQQADKEDSKIALLNPLGDAAPNYTHSGGRVRGSSECLEAEMEYGVLDKTDYSTTGDLVTFFLLGLINNSSFVIFAASAKEIASSDVGLVYLCASVPSFCIRISAPYWFDRVSYKTRIACATILMAASFTGVAFAPYQWLQLLAVMLSSGQQGLGEASFLSLCSRFGNKSLTAWSSGTDDSDDDEEEGVAGLFGYAWIIVFKTWIGLEFRYILLLANILAVGYAITFWNMRAAPAVTRLSVDYPHPEVEEGGVGAKENNDNDAEGQQHRRHPDHDLSSSVNSSNIDNEPYRRTSNNGRNGGQMAKEEEEEEEGKIGDVVKLELTTKERLFFSLSLWQITVPLIVVYMAEYAAQAGAWAAIGFPTHDKSAREQFYEYANWCYQGGVFCSRSSGAIWKPGKPTLWGMAIAQCFVLIFFVIDARYHIWYNNSLLALAFFTGLLGGAVYVNAFRLITESVPSRLKEIAMTAGAVSSDFGTNLGEALALVHKA